MPVKRGQGGQPQLPGGPVGVTRASWAQSLLDALSMPTTVQNLKDIVGWELAEGGAGPQFGVANNTANFNPLNTTQLAPSAISINTVGVKSYSSWDEGLTATAQTLNNGNYDAILQLLQAGNVSSTTFAATVNSSPWGTHDLTAALINGADLTGGGKITAAPGGTVGAGGTGTLLNTATPNFTVGDTSNPDEDYWTAINRLAQDRLWYCFADGESLYLADGPDLMKQEPALELDRIQDADVISHLDLTFDNSAWQYAVTHHKRSRAQHRAALAKVSSPVEGTLNVICRIDEVRAGDVVTLGSTGPGDGQWLAGDVRRSVFDITSEITLVPALTPLTEGQLNPAGVNKNNLSPLLGAGGTGVGSNPTGSTGALVSPFAKKYQATLGNVDMGVDFSASQGISVGDPIFAIGDCILRTIIDFSDGSFQPGMFFQFAPSANAPYWGWYVAEQITPKFQPAPKLIKAGTVVSTYSANGSGIEIGWAAAAGQTQAAADDPACAANSSCRHAYGGMAAGRSFLAFLKSVGAIV